MTTATQDSLKLHNAQLRAISEHVRNEITYRQLLEFFPMPKDRTNKIYLKAMGHGIHPRYWPMINVMRIFDFALVIDNSGSMNNTIRNNDLPKNNRTRYGELKYNCARMLDIIMSIDYNGLDIYTINPISTAGQIRSNYKSFGGSRFININDREHLQRIFSERPHSSTPLCNAVDAAIFDHKQKYYNIDENQFSKPLMLIISTDGCPNDVNRFTQIINGRTKDSVFVSFIICSDNDKDTEYLNRFDTPTRRINLTDGRNEIDGVEVIDDYKTEKEQILHIQGKKFQYSRGDHEIRKICAPVFPIMDSIDQLKISDFNKVGEDYIPPTMGELVVKIATNNSFAKQKMIQYAKNNQDIAKFMLDVPQRQNINKCCIIM